MRKRVLVGVAATVLVALVGTYLLWFRDAGEQAHAGQSSGSPAPSGASRAPVNQAHDVAVALRGLAENPGSLVASSSRGQVGDRVLQGVPPGSAVVPNEASWAPDGAGGGVIAVSLRSPGMQEMTFAVVMVLEDEHWKVVATVPISEQPASGGPTR